MSSVFPSITSVVASPQTKSAHSLTSPHTSSNAALITTPKGVSNRREMTDSSKANVSFHLPALHSPFAQQNGGSRKSDSFVSSNRALSFRHQSDRSLSPESRISSDQDNYTDDEDESEEDIPNPTYGFTRQGNSAERKQATELLRAIKSQKTSVYFDLLADLTVDQLLVLQKEFQKKPVTMCEFISLIEVIIEETVLEKSLNTQMVLRQLMNLYEQMHPKPPGLLSWNDFRDFFLTHARRSTTDTSDIPSDITKFQGHPSFVPVDGEIVERIVYLRESQKILTCDKTKVAKIRDTLSGKVIRELSGHSAAVLNARYLQKLDLYVTTSADSTMNCYDANYQRTKSIETEYPQLCLEWVDSSEGLWTGDTKGALKLWTLATKQPIKKINHAHDDWVMDLVYVPDYNVIASASLDRTVRVWDIKTCQSIVVQKGHILGVSHLAYSSFATLLLSGGSEREIFAWHPSKKGIVHRMKGHEKSVVGLYCKDGAPELISADISGCVKIWDVRRFGCVQTLTVRCNTEEEMEQVRIGSMCFDEGREQIITVGHRLQIWRPEMDRSNDITANQGITTISYLDYQAYKNFVIASGDEISIWNANQGTLEHTFKCPFEVSKVLVLERKVFVGMINGQMDVYNISTGGIMCTISLEQKDEVTYIADAGRKHFLIGTCKGNYFMYDISDMDEPRLKYNITNDGKGSTYAACCLIKHLLCISFDKLLCLYKLENGHIIKKSKTEKATSFIGFLTDIPGILTVENTTIRLWSAGNLVPLIRVDVRSLVATSGTSLITTPRQGSASSVPARPRSLSPVETLQAALEEALIGDEGPMITIHHFAPKSMYLATDSADNHIYIWNISCLVQAYNNLAATSETSGSILSAFDPAVCPQLNPSTGELNSVSLSLPKYPSNETREICVVNPAEMLVSSIETTNLAEAKLTAIMLVEKPIGLVAGCSEGRVRLYSLDGELQGRLARNGDSQWHYDPDYIADGADVSPLAEDSADDDPPSAHDKLRTNLSYGKKSERERARLLSKLSPFYTNLKTVLEVNDPVSNLRSYSKNSSLFCYFFPIFHSIRVFSFSPTNTTKIVTLHVNK
eukprot:TRINITY_DN3058_c0_g1_i1.p1 TRINITY_DN3058_c0_g1~~TRINITY_DN3058_c0_g1_i1.p1  ORF type:complete len:1082 (+),score=178.40 TRINITY_DN3058_c0_g1_i1:71-3316(+)